MLFSDTGLSAGTHTLTITVTGTKNAASSAGTVVVDAVNVPTAAQLAGYFPVVPQAGAITLDGRDSRLLVANYAFGGQQLVYSTSELMTVLTNGATIGGQDTAVLYDPAGTDGETVLNYPSQPTVTGANVTTTWDPGTGDLRLDYVHTGGTGTIFYTDGSTTSFTLDIGNFWYPSGNTGNPSNTQVAAVNYANYPTGSSGHTIYLFEQSVPLAAGKTVQAVQLPSLGSVAGYNAALHIFAMSVG